MTCLVAACFAASFHIVPFVVFSACHLANGSITSVTHSEVRPVCTLSHWRIFTSSFVASFHLQHAVGALNHIQPSLLFVSGDDLFSTPKPSRSFSNSDLRHLQHSSDSDCLPVPETFQSSSYSKPLPAIPNTTTCSFHPNTSPDTPSKGCSKTSASSKGNLETSSNSTPSNLDSALTFSRYSQSCSRDRVAPAASNIKGCIIKVIHDIKGQGWSGLVGNAG